MRGALPETIVGTTLRGIIPAYAGSTSSPSWTPQVRRDHPRVCGEHSDITADVSGELGSSPRMRGAHRERPDRLAAAGIIPAYAGSTFTRFSAQLTSSGSSPRMRGAPREPAWRRTPGGIIPAYAGST